MATKASILDLVARLCRVDTPPIVDGDLDPYLEDALAQYSRDRPYEDVEDVDGEDANLMDVPTNWEAHWSVIRKVVYPYEDEDSTVLEADDYELEVIPEGDPSSPVEHIRFKSYSPASTETVRVWFTRPHVCSDSTCTVYAQDAPAFAHLVAAKIEKAKASYFLGMQDVGIESDLVDYGAKATEARALMQAHFAAYRDGLGLPKGDQKVPASVAGDIDTPPQYPWASHQRHHRARER